MMLFFLVGGGGMKHFQVGFTALQRDEIDFFGISVRIDSPNEDERFRRTDESQKSKYPK